MEQARAVLIIGQDPQTVDLSDFAVPPGTTPEKVRAVLTAAQRELTEQGHLADIVFTDRGETAERVIREQLVGNAYDCVVIGAGIRTVPSSLMLFEEVVNAAHRGAPQAAIAFNTRPDDTATAAIRRLSAG